MYIHRVAVFTSVCLQLVAIGGNVFAQSSGPVLVRISEGNRVCPTDGQRVSYGIDRDADGALDATEVYGFYNLCNDASGTVVLSTVTPSPHCAESGLDVAAGLDTNGNKHLEPEEVTVLAPICAALGEITSVLGDLTLVTDADIAAAARVEAVRGDISIALDSTTGDMLLPNLIYVQGVVHARDNAPDPGEGGCFPPEPPPTHRRLLSLPALTRVDGLFHLMSSDVALSAPRLVEATQNFICSDDQAVLPALRRVGGQLECGDSTVILNQLTHYGWRLVPGGAHARYAAMQSVGGSNTNSGLVLQSPEIESINMPGLQYASTLTVNQVRANNAQVDLPQLQRVQGLYFYGHHGEGAPFEGYDFNRFTAPHFDTTLGDASAMQTVSPAYISVINQLRQIGGVLALHTTQYDAVNAAALTRVGAVQVVNNAALRQFSLAHLAGIILGDPAEHPYRLGMGDGDYVLLDCAYLPTQECASVLFIGNPNLQEIDLGQADNIPGALAIIEAPQLTSLAGLAQLESIRGDISVNHVGRQGADVTRGGLVLTGTGLSSLHGLENLRYVAGSVVLTHNPNLSDISALKRAHPMNARRCPLIYDNPNLSFCDVKAFASAWDFACALPESATPADLALADPCASNPCAASMQRCSVDCAQGRKFHCEEARP